MSTTVPPVPDVSAWAAGFRDCHGRAPAALHLGNIANNAYLIARALNRSGFEADVVADNYYHIMGSPEWEDADFDAAGLDENLPDWSTVDLGGFVRPRWFAQGPLWLAARYLTARRTGRPSAPALWQALRARRELSCSKRLGVLRQWVRDHRAATTKPRDIPASRDRTPVTSPLTRDFAEAFPDRTDQLNETDIAGWMPRAAAVAGLVQKYDVVQGYATEAILPMLAGFRPYVAFEHGTIRDIPFQPTPLGRLTALAYRLADEVVITNADNRVAAGRLGLERFRFVPHPVNEDEAEPSQVAVLRARLCELLGADFIVFHPSRQHWNTDYRDPNLEKGNDIFIRGFAEFVRRGGRAGAVFVEWGRTVDASRQLLAECGVANRVVWIPPQPRKAMSRYIAAADVVADQFFLGAFGSVTPQAMHARRPVLLRLDEAAHRWAFPEPPPVLNAATPEAVASHLIRMQATPAEAKRVGIDGSAWYARHHSMAAVTRAMVRVYIDALDRVRVKERAR